MFAVCWWRGSPRRWASAPSARSGQIREDTAIGVLFAAMLRRASRISTVRNFSVDLTHFMFGNVLGVSPADLRLPCLRRAGRAGSHCLL